MEKNNKEQMYIEYIRLIGLKAIAKAGTGHFGMTVSAASLTHSLYTEAMHISHEPKWINRDRFILSAGHGSTGLYPIFYLSGLMKKDFLVNFKLGNAESASHPEVTEDDYIDASTGPIGQGTGMGVGMAIAERYLAHKTKKFPGLVDHYTYVVVGDGDMQEGATHEAFQIAGTLKLHKLIVLYDANRIQFDSTTDKVNAENTKMRMESLGFDYQFVEDDPMQIKNALRKAKKTMTPSFIEVKTILGKNLVQEDTPAAHYGELNMEQFETYRKKVNLPLEGWEVPQEVSDYYHKNVKDRGNQAYEAWQNLVKKYKKQNPEEMKTFFSWFTKGEFSTDWLKSTIIQGKNRSIVDYFKDINNHFNDNVPNILTLNADLGGATFIQASQENFPQGTHLLVGIREFAMANIMNGINLHGGLNTMASSFLSFSGYLMASYRLGAMMKLNSTYVFGFDSYLVGSDGPTHEPYNQVPAMRAVANTMLWRPANEMETLAAFQAAFESKETTNVIIGTHLPVQSRKTPPVSVIRTDGIYALQEVDDAEIVFAASGSEIDLAFKLAEELKEYKVRVVSVPALALSFMNEEKTSKLLEASKLLVTLEATSDANWYRLREYSSAPRHLHHGAYDFGFSHIDGRYVYEQRGFSITNLLPKIKAKLV